LILFLGSTFSECNILTRFGAGAGVNFFGTGGESRVKKVTPTTYGPYRKLAGLMTPVEKESYRCIFAKFNVKKEIRLENFFSYAGRGKHHYILPGFCLVPNFFFVTIRPSQFHQILKM